jgi:hypothetical protein
MPRFPRVLSKLDKWNWTPALVWGCLIVFVIAGNISRASKDHKRPAPAPSYSYATPRSQPATVRTPRRNYLPSSSTYTPSAPPTIRDPFASPTLTQQTGPFAAPVVRLAALFIEVDAPQGMRAWSDGSTLIYVKGGKLAGTFAVGGSTTATTPPAGTALYRPNGTFAGWIGPDDARPPNTRSIAVPPVFTPVVGENGTHWGDISDATGRPKTVYVNGHTRSDGTYVRGHWRSPPGSGSASTYKPTYTDPGVAENGSYYGQTSTYNGLPKTTHVSGYYRRDGTYVRGHYRSR